MTQYVFQKIGTFLLFIGILWGLASWSTGGKFLFTEYGPITKVNWEKTDLRQGAGAELTEVAKIDFEYKKSDGTIGHVREEFDHDSRAYSYYKSKKIYATYHGGKIFLLLFLLIGGGLCTFFSFIDGWHTDDVIGNESEYADLRELVVNARLQVIYWILIFIGYDKTLVTEAIKRYTSNDSNMYRSSRWDYKQIPKINKWSEYWTGIKEDMHILETKNKLSEVEAQKAKTGNVDNN